MSKLRLALGQLNPTLGAFDHNIQCIRQMVAGAVASETDVLIFGELALTGYPLEDLALNEHFLTAAHQALQELAQVLHADGFGNLPIIIGHPSAPIPSQNDDPWAPQDPRSTNCASLLYQGAVTLLHEKQHLPNYAVFDEQRTFLPGTVNRLIELGDIRVAVMICEDLWRFAGPVATAQEQQVDLVLTLNASPYTLDKDELRVDLLKSRAQQLNAPIAYVNLVGGQDELVFDGQSMVIGPQGEFLARAHQFAEELLIVDLELPEATSEREPITDTVQLKHSAHHQSTISATLADEADTATAEMWQAITLGLRDYVHKNGFTSVLLGLSGGIDSAVVAALAVDALGAEQVYAVSMPSKYSSNHSRDDAHELAERTGLNYRVETIADLVAPIENQLALDGIAAENLQARIRAVILMGISNTDGQLVLTTGNKTEVAVGYSTIYGDSIGAFAPLKDVLKTQVWELARWRNEEAISLGLVPPIPENSIAKPPSAELRPGQVDQDSLPDYLILDAIITGLVIDHQSVAQLVNAGHDESVVRRVAGLIRQSEWKRHQGTLGPKISSLAFGRDRRIPITNAFETE